MISEIALRFKQISLKSKYEDPFNRLGADATSQTDRHHVCVCVCVCVYIYGLSVYFAEKSLKP